MDISNIKKIDVHTHILPPIYPNLKISLDMEGLFISTMINKTAVRIWSGMMVFFLEK